MAEKFLVAPFKSGLRDDLAPWLIPEDAFTRLNNAYILRGRLKKRFGSKLIGTTTVDQFQHLNSRLRIDLGTTDAVTGNIAGTIPGAAATYPTFGRFFSVGEAIYTIHQLGTPADMLQTIATTTATYDTTTGAYSFTGAALDTKLYFYPTQAVLGFANHEKGPVNQHNSFAFDNQFAYEYSGTAWERSGTALFKGTDSDLFWTCNWQGITDDLIAMFVTNFNVTATGIPAATDDPMYYYNGTTWTNFSNSTVFNTAGNKIASASILVPFKNRLLAIDVVEFDGTNNKRYANRIRYCHNGSPFATSAWLEPSESFGGSSATGGGHIDGPIEEEITSVAFIKDRLVVYCERSTWEISYTGNSAIPFVWEAINQTLGSEAKFSTVIFDKNTVTIGTTGINSCNGSYVQRIDEEIPEKIFEILKTTEGTKRICGVRDYFNELVYWSYLKQDHAVHNSYNDSLIVYNYKEGIWAFNDDCITSFGYLEQEKDITNANSKQILCGNQQGFVFVVDSSEGKNSHGMALTNITYTAPDSTLTIYGHNIRVGDFIKLEYVNGLTGFTSGIYKVNAWISADQVSIPTAAFTGTYSGGGMISRVSRMEIETKDMNPFVKEGGDVSLVKVEFNIEKTEYGEVTIDYSTSSSSLNMIAQESASGANLGNNILETRPYTSGGAYIIPLEEFQQNMWHDIFLDASGSFVKLKISLSDAQMADVNIVESMFTLNGMILCMQGVGR